MPTLNWLTREEDVGTTRRVPYRLLEEAHELSSGRRDTGNMLIQGDNLEALKALLPFYAGRIKCIYIDPPYNTRSAFEHYDDNLEHTKWLRHDVAPFGVTSRTTGRGWLHLGFHRRQREPLPQSRHGRNFRTVEFRRKCSVAKALHCQELSEVSFRYA